MTRYKAAFFGTPEFSVPSLKLLHESESIELVSVVTMPDRPSGRGKKVISPAVAIYAKENNIPLIQTANINKDELALKIIKEADLDFIIVIAFAQFLGVSILESTKIGCFNIHTSLLPKYRGAAPIQYALLNGDKKTGVTIQKMVKEMDAGDLALSKEISIDENITGGELFNILKDEASNSLYQFIETLSNNSMILTPQSQEGISFAPTLKKEDGRLLFESYTAEEIRNRVRAFFPWPGSFCFLNQKRLKVIKVQIEQSSLPSGETSTQFGTLLIGCKKGTLRLTEVQLDGKKACSDFDLINGLKNKYESFHITSEE